MTVPIKILGPTHRSFTDGLVSRVMRDARRPPLWGSAGPQDLLIGEPTMIDATKDAPNVPKSREKGHFSLDATRSCADGFHLPRSHAPRGNAVFDAPRPGLNGTDASPEIRSASSPACWPTPQSGERPVPTRSVGTRGEDAPNVPKSREKACNIQVKIDHSFVFTAKMLVKTSLR